MGIAPGLMSSLDAGPGRGLRRCLRRGCSLDALPFRRAVLDSGAQVLCSVACLPEASPLPLPAGLS